MKKRMNRKGFTLVELLAVVVILLLISTIAISSISAAIERQNEKKDDATEEIIKSYAKLYFDDFKNTAVNNEGKGCVNISRLKTQYNLDENAIKKSDGSSFNGCVYLLNNSLSVSVGVDYSCDGVACVCHAEDGCN